MQDRKMKNGQRMPEEAFSEFGVVRVISKPAPDAEDRLRRLFTILQGQSAGENRTELEKDSPADDRQVGDRLEEAEA